MALVKRSGGRLFIHRLLQDVVYFNLSNEERQQAFDTAVQLVNRLFPKATKTKFLFAEWKECATNIRHVEHLSERYMAASRHQDMRLQPNQWLRELIKNGAWYET
jgi:predicted ATPase